jgi:hypothetical protein
VRIDYNKPVWVYRNLSRGRRTRPLYSIMQGGRVLRRSHRILLANCKFVVREAGRQKVLQDGRKNVHAFVVGRIVGSAMGIDRNHGGLPVRIIYNPRNDATFMACPNTDWPYPAYTASAVLLNECGMFAAYLN